MYGINKKTPCKNVTNWISQPYALDGKPANEREDLAATNSCVENHQGNQGEMK